MKSAFLSLLLFLASIFPLFGSAEWHEVVSATDKTLRSVAFGNGTFVAVGDTIVSATDPGQWSESVQGEEYLLHQIIHAEDRFFAVGRTVPAGQEHPEPRILTSPNGEIWSVATLPDFPAEAPPVIEVRSIAFRDGIWIAVTWPRAVVLRSEDGFAWEAVEGVAASGLDQVAATESGFTAFGPGWIYESTNGLDWSTRRSGSIEQTADQIAYGNGRFLGRDSSGAWSSLDGTARLYFDSAFSGVGYAGGLFAKLSGSEVRLSADLGDWGALDAAFPQAPRAVAASENSVVVVGDAGMIRFLDGSWPPVVTSEPTTDRQVYFAGSRLSLKVEAVGSGTLTYQWRKDGADLPGEINPSLVIQELAVADAGTYSVRISNRSGSISAESHVAVAPETAILPPEAAWRRSDSPPAVKPDLLSYGNGRFLGVAGDSNSTTVVHSRSGSGTWEHGRFRNFGLFARNRPFVGGQFFIGGLGSEGAALLVSPDGAVWARANLPEGLVGPVFSVAWGNGIYLASGPGWMLHSEDGRNWKQVASGQITRAIAFGDGYFLALSNNWVYRSEDGETWEAHGELLSGMAAHKLLFEGGRWWALGLQTAGAMQSLDGKIWTDGDDLQARDLVSVNGVLISAGDDGIRYSHGAEWSIPASPSSAVSVIASGDGRIVAVGDGVAMVRSAEIAPAITIQPRITGANYRAVGSEITLVANAVGSGKLHYQWFKNGNPLWGENFPVLRIPNMTRHRTGTYRAEIWNEAGGVRSEEVVLFVGPDPLSPLWATTLPKPVLRSYRSSIAWGNGRFVAADFDKLYTSPDGLSWSERRVSSVQILSPVIFDGEKFFAGGYNTATGRPILLHSADGTAWGAVELMGNPNGPHGPMFSLAYGDGIYLASSPSGTFRSEDGETWERIPDFDSRGFFISIAYGDGCFLGLNGSTIWRSCDGREWSQAHVLQERVETLSFLRGRWWLGTDTGKLYQSLDGIRWVDSDVGPATGVSVADNGELLLVFGNGGRFFTGNGADWGSTDALFPHHALSDIFEGGGRLLFFHADGVAVRDTGIPPAITMQPTVLEVGARGPSGAAWIGGELELNVHAVGSGELRYQWFFNDATIPGARNSRFVLDDIRLLDVGTYRVEVSNPYGVVSSDALSVRVLPNPPIDARMWNGPTGVWLHDVAFGNGRFVGIGQGGIYQSRDGVSWRGGNTLNFGWIENIFFGGGKFIAIPGRSGPNLYHSDDGAAWNAARLPEGTTGVQSVAWGNGVFVAGTGNGVLRSEDAADWERVANEPIWSVAYGNGFFLGALSQTGRIFKSTDGREWNLLGEAPLGSIREIQFVAGRFFLLGYHKLGIAHSTNGVTWEAIPNFPYTEKIFASDGVLVASGIQGGILYGTLDARHWTSFQAPPYDLPQAVGSGRIVGRSSQQGAAIVRRAEIEPYLAEHPAGFLAIAAGESAEIVLTPIGKPPFTYSWYRGDTWIADTAGPVLEIPNASPADEGEYRLLITSSAGATFSDPITLYVQTPPVIVSQPGAVFANPGETVRLAVAVEGGPATYEWSKNGTDLGSTAEPSYEIENVTAADAGEYVVTVSNAAGSVSSEPISLRVILEYADWLDSQIAAGADPATLAQDSDPTGSGVPNLLRYALHLSAENPRAGLPHVAVETDSEDPSYRVLVFTFQRRKEAQDLRLSVENSAALSGWSEIELSEADVTVEDAGAVEIVTLRYPLDGSAEEVARFFRLAVEKVE